MSYQRAQFATRRQQTWGRNQNTTRFVSPVKLGPVSFTVVVSLMILVLGLIYLTQASVPATYDYAADTLNREIEELSIKKVDLEVENARLSSLESIRNSDVAQAMTAPESVEYAR